MKKTILFLLVLALSSCVKENLFKAGDKVYLKEIVVVGNTIDNLQKFKESIVKHTDEGADMVYFGQGGFFVSGDCVEVVETIGVGIVKVADYCPILQERGERQFYAYSLDLYRAAKKIE